MWKRACDHAAVLLDPLPIVRLPRKTCWNFLDDAHARRYSPGCHCRRAISSCLHAREPRAASRDWSPARPSAVRGILVSPCSASSNNNQSVGRCYRCAATPQASRASEHDQYPILSKVRIIRARLLVRSRFSPDQLGSMTDAATQETPRPHPGAATRRSFLPDCELQRSRRLNSLVTAAMLSLGSASALERAIATSYSSPLRSHAHRLSASRTSSGICVFHVLRVERECPAHREALAIIMSAERWMHFRGPASPTV